MHLQSSRDYVRLGSPTSPEAPRHAQGRKQRQPHEKGQPESAHRRAWGEQFSEDTGLPQGHLDLERRSQRPADQPVGVPLTTEVITLVAKLMSDEGVSVPPLKLADIINLALVDAAEHGGQPRPEMVQRLVRLMK